MKRNKTMNTTFKLKVLISSEAFKNSTPKFPVKKKELEKLANSRMKTITRC